MSIISPILYILGFISMSFSFAMLPPLLVDYYNGHSNYMAFLFSAVFSGTLGALLYLSQKTDKPIELNVKQGFILTTTTWIYICFLASLPFIFSKATTSLTDSLFESVSALTTTGASVLTTLSQKSFGILMWRSLLQWMGGIGIIVMAIILLPFLRIGGMQLFRSEFSDKSEKILPKVSQITKEIMKVYLGLTLLCAISLFLAGMAPYEAINHAMSTLSTGGFSTRETSIAEFNSPLIEAITIPFMILGGITFILFVKFANGDKKSFLRDTQLQLYLLIISLSIIAVFLWELHTKGEHMDQLVLFIDVAFNVVSVMTTTGFAASDFALMDNFPILLLFIICLIGGCTGSTAGGIKVFRIQIMYAQALSNMYKLRHPSAVSIPMYNGKEISENVFLSVSTYITFFTLTFIISSLVLALNDMDFMTSISATAASLTSLGPGFTDPIGPYGSYANFPDICKWTVMVNMILGRLEFIAVFILFTKDFWNN